MPFITNPISLTALRRSEAVQRARLANEPGDGAARLKLAWSLFVKALFRAGQESMVLGLFAADDRSPQDGSRMKQIWDEDSGQLIDACLREALTAREFSVDPDEQIEIVRLLSLLKMIGAPGADLDSIGKAGRIHQSVLREIMDLPVE